MYLVKHSHHTKGQTMLILIGIGFLSVLIVALLALLLGIFFYKAAKNEQQATFTPEGSIQFIVAGENRLRTIVNVDGYVMTTSGEIKRRPQKPHKRGDPAEPDVSDPHEPVAKPNEVVESWGPLHYLENKWGFYWVSLFYPWVKVHKFKISKERLKTRSEVGEGSPLRARIEHDPELQEISHLKFRFPRPFLFESVETSDRLETDIIVAGIFQVVRPDTTIFLIGGSFFVTLEAAIAGVVLDYMKARTYTEFVDAEKGKGSPFSQMVKAINNGSSAVAPNGIIQDIGIKIVDIWVEDQGLSKSEDEARKATKAKEIAILKGDAEIQAAERKLKSEELLAQAAAARPKALREAYGNSAEAAALASRQIVSEQLGNGKLTTLVMSESGAMVSIPVAPPPPTGP